MLVSLYRKSHYLLYQWMNKDCDRMVILHWEMCKHIY